MSHIDDLKIFANGGMDTDSAFPFVSKEDWIIAFNSRVIGTTGSEFGYVTNPESSSLVAGERAVGINKGIGGRAFEDIRQILMFIYNSAGFHQIAVYNADTKTQQIIYTDKTDSGGEQLLNLDPQYYVQCILINSNYPIWADGKNEIGYTNLTTLASGGYGTVLAEDLSLIKPQNLKPITGVYIDDAGKAANFVKGKLFQFTSQYINADFNYSTWGTWSKRIIPLQESTPTTGTDVSQNNCIVVSVDIGSIRATQLNVACRYGLFDFNIIKTVDRSYILALPNTAVDITMEIYEAYDPSTNLYSFCFYNESLNIPVAPTETDLFVDYLWPATAIEKINGNITAIGDLKVGYDRPTTVVTVGAVGYDPNLSVPSSVNPNPLRVIDTFPGEPGSGAGNHQRYISATYTGVPHTNDIITITTYDIRDATVVQTYSYTVPSAQDGQFVDAILSFAHLLPSANVQDISGTNTTLKVTFVGIPYNQLQSATITIYNGGATISKSIHAFADNSSYQAALSYRDKWGRRFPLRTDNTFIFNTPSFAQLMGQTPRFSWNINDITAPVGAVDYQWLFTNNTTVINMLDVFGNLLVYVDGWNAGSNTPTLTANTGNVGETYQITDPSDPANPVNLGNGVQDFKTGDYVVYNGKSWDIVSKDFGDLTTTGNVLAIKINPLFLFNQKYTNSGVDPILTYDFVAGDRCTLHYYIDPSAPLVKNYLNNPCIDVQVYGYDPTNYLVKIEKPSAISVPGPLDVKNIFLRLYSPNTQKTGTVATTDNTTVWFEVGERYTITNGNHDILSGTITEGDVYFKTRSYNGAVDPNVSYDILATDFNFSDFYVSNFTSYGRPRSFYDVLEKTEQKASIIYSQNYVSGSRKNGLNRFYPENIYGESDGQTSSSYGAIQVLWQRGDLLEVFQELRIGSIPVNRSILEDQAQQQQYAISEKLLNNIRYSQTASVGIGLSKESFCFKDNNAYFVDPNRSEPFRYGLDGIQSISSKMTKYFKSTLQLAYSQGKKIVMYYNMFYDEVMLCIQADGGVLTFFPFNESSWKIYTDYAPVAGDVLTLGSGLHSSISFNPGTLQFTITPDSGYVGNDTSQFSLNTPNGIIFKNICTTWTAGDSDPLDFSFSPLIDVPVSTIQQSNTILVGGITIPVAISITGGQYKINGGSYTSSAGTVVNGDVVQVRQTSSASNSTTTTATLTISTKSANFDITTISANAYRVNTAYGYSITSITDNTATGTPAAVNTLSLPPNGSISVAYTAITAGTVNVVITGTAVFPSQKLDLYVNGVNIQRVSIPTAGTYQLTFPNVTSPTPILIGIAQS